MTTTVIFYRTFNDNIPIVDWVISDRLLTHIEKFSRFTWYINSENRQVIIKQFNYTVCSLSINNYLPFRERYSYANTICRFLETLPPHKPLPVINESTHPEFYI